MTKLFSINQKNLVIQDQTVYETPNWVNPLTLTMTFGTGMTGSEITYSITNNTAAKQVLFEKFLVYYWIKFHNYSLELFALS